MRRLLIVVALVLATVSVIGVVSVSAAGPEKCSTIQSGSITDSYGSPVTVGYDRWGYNYQARMFNGFYDNFTKPAIPVTSGDRLEMKWNDAWLSNVDCDGDGKLDRHYGFASYKGSGAWLTNHIRGTYEENGATYRYTDFVKIVAVPADAVLVGGTWNTADGKEIGPAIWGDFAIVQEVYTDTGTGDHGLLSKSPASPGLGIYKP